MDLPFNNASACRVMAICSSLKLSNYECYAFGHTKGNTFDGVADQIVFHNDPYPNSFSGYIKTFGKTKTIKNHLSQFDPNEIEAIFFTTIGHIQLKYLGKWCRKHKIPLIFDCGDIIRSSTKNVLFKLVSSVEYHLYHHVVKKYASVMAISSYIYDMFKDKCIHTFIVPCIAKTDSERFTQSPNVDVDTNAINIGYFGVPGKKFNKDKLNWCLDSYKKYSNKNMNFYVAGVDEKELPSEYQSIENVLYLGKLSNSECIGYIKKLDFVIFFRTNNEIAKAGFPSKVTEAFACNTPVMTNITSDLNLYLNEKNSISVEGFEKEKCDSMFQMLCSTNKEHISNLKHYISLNNKLVAEVWKDVLIKNIKVINDKINQQ